MFDEQKLSAPWRKKVTPFGSNRGMERARQSQGRWIGQREKMPAMNIPQQRSEKRASPRRREMSQFGLRLRGRRTGALQRVGQVLWNAESEAHFQQRVIQAAKLLGWLLVYHTWDSRRSPSGFPDLVLVNEKQHRHIFVELKAQRGRLTLAQERWRDGLERVGCEWYCWRPSDWEQLIQVLRSR
jgi:hypothetical protein